MVLANSWLISVVVLESVGLSRGRFLEIRYLKSDLSSKNITFSLLSIIKVWKWMGKLVQPIWDESYEYTAFEYVWYKEKTLWNIFFSTNSCTQEKRGGFNSTSEHRETTLVRRGCRKLSDDLTISAFFISERPAIQFNISPNNRSLPVHLYEINDNNL